MKTLLNVCATVILTVYLGRTETMAQENSYVDGELLVQLKPEVNIQDLLDRHKNIGLTANELLWSGLRIWWLTFDEQVVSAQNALDGVRANQDVTFAQLNHYITLRSTIPDDPRFGEQWALNNIGQTGGTADADIDGPEAWDIATGGVTTTGDQIVVAVIDNGFDLNHEDISFFKNEDEIPGNGVDDDGNGYIDDYDGWNAYSNTGNVPPDGQPPYDHGTHVVGIAVAEGNNGIGVAGVNWDAKVLSVAGASTTEAIVVRMIRPTL